MRVIYSEDLASFINREPILNKNIILYRKYVSLNLIFEQVITQLMAWKGSPPFINIKYYDLLHFQRSYGCSFIYYKDYIDYKYE